MIMSMTHATRHRRAVFAAAVLLMSLARCTVFRGRVYWRDPASWSEAKCGLATAQPSVPLTVVVADMYEAPLPGFTTRVESLDGFATEQLTDVQGIARFNVQPGRWTVRTAEQQGYVERHHEVRVDAGQECTVLLFVRNMNAGVPVTQ
jgi:hypothetical protein